MSFDREAAQRAFLGYVEAYDATNPRIALKVDHTLRVASLCDDIAQSLGLSVEDQNLAWLCGLLHDIGRFEQVRRWDTFNDAISCSHAALGVEILFGEERLGDFASLSSHDASVLHETVAHHSDFRLPGNLDSRTRILCDLLRDADKIDIVKAACLSPVEAIFGVREDALYRSPLSPTVEQAFYEHRCILRSERHFPADIVASFGCFAFELVNPRARQLMAEQGAIFDMLDQPFELPETRDSFDWMACHLRDWLSENAL